MPGAALPAHREAVAVAHVHVRDVGATLADEPGGRDDEALEEFFPHMKETRDRIGAERGWGPMTRASFDHEASEQGSLYIGSPDTVARKIAHTVRALGVERFDMKYSDGRLPHEKLVRCIELYGSKVIPMVRELLGE